MSAQPRFSSACGMRCNRFRGGNSQLLATGFRFGITYSNPSGRGCLRSQSRRCDCSLPSRDWEERFAHRLPLGDGAQAKTVRNREKSGTSLLVTQARRINHQAMRRACIQTLYLARYLENAPFPPRSLGPLDEPGNILWITPSSPPFPQNFKTRMVSLDKQYR